MNFSLNLRIQPEFGKILIKKNTDTSYTLELRYDVRQMQFKTITLGSIHGEKMTWMTRKGPNFPRGLKRKVIEW